MSRRRGRMIDRLVVLLLVALVVLWLVSRVSTLAAGVLGLVLLPAFVALGLWSYVDDLRPPRRDRRK